MSVEGVSRQVGEEAQIHAKPRNYGRSNDWTFHLERPTSIDLQASWSAVAPVAF
jgi:hypothetical protein